MASKSHIVEAGECIYHLADKYGLPWEKIWDHSGNKDLKDKRKLPNILLPGDEVKIPELELREESGQTEKRHEFRKKRIKVEVRVRVLELSGPRKDEPYHLEIGRTRIPGKTEKTDDEGMAICSVPPDVKEAVLVVGEEKDEYKLLIGHLDPRDTSSGLHGRLENLGFEVGGIDTPYDEDSLTGVEDFLVEADKEPEDHDLEEKADDPALDAIEEGYGT